MERTIGLYKSLFLLVVIFRDEIYYWRSLGSLEGVRTGNFDGSDSRLIFTEGNPCEYLAKQLPVSHIEPSGIGTPHPPINLVAMFAFLS